MMAKIWIGAVLLAALLSPFALRGSAEAMDFTRVLEAPSAQHLLGTDLLGRDVLSRLLCGASVSIGISLMAVGIALFVGTWLGALAGYYGGAVDRLLMGVVDLFLCFPVFFLILAVVSILGPGMLNIMLIIGFTSWMGTARLVRAEVLSLREREFIQAAKAMGAGPVRIIARHLVPNAMAPVLVSGLLGVSSAILVETGLSFLGIGVQPPTPSWGNLLTDAKATLGVAWWLSLFPGLAIFLTVLSLNAIGEKLNESVARQNPRPL